MLNMADQEQKNYYYKVNAEYAEAMFQKMASIRYGIDFCCTPDLIKWSIKKDLLDMNNAMDSTCPNPDNIPQPGDPDYVPGPCGVIDVTYGTEGGSLKYVPCNAYIFKTVEYAAGNSGTDRICYDTNVGFTIDGDVTATLSEEECEQPVETICYVFKAVAPPKQFGTVVYVPCGSTETITVELSSQVSGIINQHYGCYDASTEIITTGGVIVTSDQVLCNDDNKVCITVTFTLASPTVPDTITSGSASGVDCNGNSFSFNESLEYSRTPYSWSSPPICINLNENTNVHGEMQTIVGETCT